MKHSDWLKLNYENCRWCTYMGFEPCPARWKGLRYTLWTSWFNKNYQYQPNFKKPFKTVLQPSIIFLNGPFLDSFSLFSTFIYSWQKQINVRYKSLQMTGFKLRTSGVRSDCSTNWATTTARPSLIVIVAVLNECRKRFRFTKRWR